MITNSVVPIAKALIASASNGMGIFLLQVLKLSVLATVGVAQRRYEFDDHARRERDKQLLPGLLRPHRRHFGKLIRQLRRMHAPQERRPFVGTLQPEGDMVDAWHGPARYGGA